MNARRPVIDLLALGEVIALVRGRRPRRRRKGARRRHQGAAVILAGGLVLFVADVALHIFGLVLLAAALAAAAYLAGRRSRPEARAEDARPVPPPIPPSVFDGERDRLGAELVSVRAELARTQASLGDARASAGVEAAARTEQYQAELARVRGQVTELEDAAGRPIEAIIATYHHVQQQYGAAAVGKQPGHR